MTIDEAVLLDRRIVFMLKLWRRFWRRNLETGQDECLDRQAWLEELKRATTHWPQGGAKGMVKVTQSGNVDTGFKLVHTRLTEATHFDMRGSMLISEEPLEAVAVPRGGVVVLEVVEDGN